MLKIKASKRVLIKKSFINNYIQVALVALTLNLFLSCNGSKTVVANENWITTWGTLSGVTHNRKIRYEVNGQYYSQRFYKSYYGMVPKGEKYELKYNPNNPLEIEICYSCPIFLEDENTKIIVGEVKQVEWVGGKIYKHLFLYSYTIGGVKKVKEQGLPINFREIYPELEEGQRYYVEFWLDDPDRAVMHLNKPAL